MYVCIKSNIASTFVVEHILKITFSTTKKSFKHPFAIDGLLLILKYELSD